MKTIKMKLSTIVIILLCVYSISSISQTDLTFSPAKVDFDAYEKLVAEVKEHRKTRLINLQTFHKMAKEEKVIILDTRSDAMYASKHVKGAIHLNFADFTQTNLARIIPSPDYKILIYCNNNFDNDEVNFASKAYVPKVTNNKEKALTLALNIPTYINLYGYGYKNVYELNELISIYSNVVEFEGTAVYSKSGK